MTDHPSPLPQTLLLKAARRLMRPLVRLMLRNGLTFPILADSLRSLFIEVAVNDVLTEPKSQTDSRISLLTGVHRKEIKRLREVAADPAEPPEVVTVVGQIVARWVGSPVFATASGQPRPLLRTGHGVSAQEPTFDSLVESVTTDIRPRAVLDDLLGHGVVYMDAEDRVQLRTEAFLPRPGGEEQLFYFARNLHDHVASAVANISTSGSPPFLDRSVHYDRLTPVQAKELEDFARRHASDVLLEVNRRALELTGDAEGGDETAHHRINFGLYVFYEDEHMADRGTP